MKNVARPFAAVLALAIALAAASGVLGAPKKSPDASASPAASGSPVPLPTATPEPADVAIPRLEAKIKADPNDKEALSDLAGYYLAIGRPDQALSLTQRLLSLGAKNAQVYYLDGSANQGLGRVNEATADFEQAANLEPTNAQVLLTLTNLYLQTNRPADAERVAKRATTFNLNDKRAFENYGLVLAQEKKYDEARQQFEVAAKLDPKDPLPVVLEARSYIDQNAIALAQQLFDRALAIDPKSPDALLGKARLLAANHDVKNSIATYEQLLPVVGNDDQKAAVLVEEAQLYRTEKMNQEAEDILKRGESQYPNAAAIHIAYGDYYAGVKKDQAAAENEWKTALGSKRDNPDALQRLAELSLAQNKVQQGIDYFKRLTEVVPNDPAAWAQLAQVYGGNKQFDKARDAFRRSFELSRAPQALGGLGSMDYELKSYKECGQIFDALDKNAADYLKANPQLYFVMGKCYVATGQKDKAKSALLRLQPLLKPGTTFAVEVKKMLASLNHVDPPRPQPTKH